jgi:outer membrane protein, heavy metal efflux system
MAFRLRSGAAMVCGASVFFAALTHAQSPITIADALAHAWARHPASQSAAARMAETEAKRAAAASFTPTSPTLALSQLSDSRFSNQGRRATEAELSIPIWNWGARSAAGALANAEGGVTESQLAATKLKLSGELREALWALALARVEDSVAARKVADAKALSEDVALRVRAGDLAPVDANLAQSALRLAELGAAQARDATLRAEVAVHMLLGKSDVTPIGETHADAPNVDAHPNVRAAQRTRDAAQARVASARAETREGPTVSFTLSRERSNLDAAVEKALRIGVSIPLFANREAPARVASAQTELAETNALALQMRAQVAAEFSLSSRAVEIAKEIASAADARAQLARETQAMFIKSFQLGESDLPTRLRAETERFEAERAAERARIESLRAVSRLNQAFGVTP